ISNVCRWPMKLIQSSRTRTACRLHLPNEKAGQTNAGVCRPLSAWCAMTKIFDPDDYSVVVKHRAPPPNSWRWEIYRAGRSSPIRQSTTYFHTMAAASKEGKEALKQLLDRIPA